MAKKYPIVQAVESFDLESSTSNLKKWQSIIWLDEQFNLFLSPFVSGRAVCLSLCFAKCFDPCDKGYLADHSDGPISWPLLLCRGARRPCDVNSPETDGQTKANCSFHFRDMINSCLCMKLIESWTKHCQ